MESRLTYISPDKYLECSLNVAYNLAIFKKPYTDAENVVKKSMVDVHKILFGSTNHIDNIALSDTTMERQQLNYIWMYRDRS